MALRTASLALAMLLGMAMPSKAAWTQEVAATTKDPVGQSEGVKQEPGSSDQVRDDKTPAAPTADTSSKTAGSETPAAEVDGQNPKPHTGGRKKNATKSTGVVAGKSPIRNVAEETLDSLDSAVNFAQKSASPGGSPEERVNDFTARRDELRQKANAAKDDAAWIGIAKESAATLADVLKRIEANAGSSADGGTGSPSTASHSVPPQSQSRDSLLRPSTLPLYVAGLSLLISVLSLGGGWLLARHEINKALTEAGLL